MDLLEATDAGAVKADARPPNAIVDALPFRELGSGDRKVLP